MCADVGVAVIGAKMGLARRFQTRTAVVEFTFAQILLKRHESTFSLPS